MRFQKRIKILPGVNINISKSGISTSVGPRGAKVTIGKGKIRQTVGIPGTGLSQTTVTKISPESGQQNTNIENTSQWGFFKLLGAGIGLLFVMLVIFGIFQR